MRPDSPYHSKGFGKWGATGLYIASFTGKGKRVAPYPTGTGKGKGRGGAIGPSTKQEMWDMSIPNELEKEFWAPNHREEADYLDTLDVPSLLGEVHEMHLLVSNILAQPWASPLYSPVPRTADGSYRVLVCAACLDRHKAGCDFADCENFEESNLWRNKVWRMRDTLSKIDYVLNISRPPIPLEHVEAGHRPVPSSSSSSADEDCTLRTLEEVIGSS